MNNEIERSCENCGYPREFNMCQLKGWGCKNHEHWFPNAQIFQSTIKHRDEVIKELVEALNEVMCCACSNCRVHICDSKDKLNKIQIVSKYADNGEFSHYELIDTLTGKVLWMPEKTI
jgi:hypothetical protein